MLIKLNDKDVHIQHFFYFVLLSIFSYIMKPDLDVKSHIYTSLWSLYFTAHGLCCELKHYAISPSNFLRKFSLTVTS